MWQYEKKLQYPVKVATPNPKLAAVIISQYGGPDGELGDSLLWLRSLSRSLVVRTLKSYI